VFHLKERHLIEKETGLHGENLEDKTLLINVGSVLLIDLMIGSFFLQNKRRFFLLLVSSSLGARELFRSFYLSSMK
jgi:hypothetical protein